MLSFSAIISAVKPKERTDQYKVLAALYCLDAHRASVTAKQVTDILKLNLGKDTPLNVYDRLRKYTGYVEAVDKGPPLRWLLTQKGLNHLRELSGLALSTITSDSDFRSDIGIICALEQPEFSAVITAFGGMDKWREIGSTSHTHVYRETEMSTKSGKKLKIVGTTATSMGLTAAAIATTHLVLQFRPKIVVMIGIAAGTRSGNKQFGDVLVADPSVDYNSGKVVQANGIRDFLPDPYPLGLNARLRSVLKKYGASHPILSAVQARWPGDAPSQPNRLHVGPLGAADQVIDDAERIVEIQKNWRKLIGVEMETYGVYRACHEAPEPKPRFISFKSVCDFAAEKSDSWQDYAAYVAAEFAVEFFKSEWEALWPTS